MDETILCVDNCEPLLKFRKFLLETVGYRAITATTAFEALRLFATEKIDLVLADYFLPGEITGLMLAAKIKELSPGTPILSCSEAVELPTTKNFDGFVRKTEKAQVLLGEIGRALKKRTAGSAVPEKINISA
jgi:CheY-like chemotaxis protein